MPDMQRNGDVFVLDLGDGENRPTTIKGRLYDSTLSALRAKLG